VGGGRSTIEVCHAPMSDDQVQSSVTYRGPSHFDMDEAFCARMRTAIKEGLESAPIGVITTPGTQNPRYVSNLTAKYHRPRDER
jgi:hypothetical protein